MDLKESNTALPEVPGLENMPFRELFRFAGYSYIKYSYSVQSKIIQIYHLYFHSQLQLLLHSLNLHVESQNSIELAFCCADERKFSSTVLFTELKKLANNALPVKYFISFGIPY